MSKLSPITETNQAIQPQNSLKSPRPTLKKKWGHTTEHVSLLNNLNKMSNSNIQANNASLILGSDMFSKVLMSDPNLIKQTSRVLYPQIERRIKTLEECEADLDKKCETITEREDAKLRDLKNRFDQRCREVLADIERSFLEKKMVLKDKILREQDKKTKLEYLMTLKDPNSILRTWPEVEKAEAEHDRLDPYNVVGLGHSLRVQTPPLKIENQEELKRNIERMNINTSSLGHYGSGRNRNISSTPLPGQIGILGANSQSSLSKTLPMYKPAASFNSGTSMIREAARYSGQGPYPLPKISGVHRSLNLELFPIGIHWALDPKSISHIHSDFVQISSQGYTLKIRDEARAYQRKMIKQNGHNLGKYWLNCLGNKSLSGGMMYFEAAVSRSEAWRVGITARDEYITNRYLADLKFMWTVSYQAFPKPSYKFECGMNQKPTMLSIKVKISRIGVLVDYDRGEISFYSCGSGFSDDERRHIYSVKSFFQDRSLFPYFAIKQGKINVVPFSEPPFGMYRD